MSLPWSFRRSVSLALLLAVAAALIVAAPALFRAPVASAQICPGGGIVYGATSCPGFGPSTPSGGPSATGGYSTCPDGSVVFPGQFCGNAGPAFCPGGTLVGAGQACPPNNGLSACPGGVAVPIGQTCSITSLVPCPGGGSVRVGQTCPTAATITCPNGVIVAVTQSCPSATTYDCGGGVRVPLGQPCPNQPGSTVCPNNEVLPAGEQCPGPSPSAPPPSTPAPPPGPSVTYRGGWNIVAGPAGATLTGALGPLYTLQPGDTSYETVAPGSPLKAGAGYLAYFSTDTTVTLPMAGPGSMTVPLPAGQFVLIGNPGDSPATVTGADTVLILDPATSGYSQTTTLAPGQGGWAISSAGGQATITNPS